jgi:methanogenic corrinoid protein MtbC1
MAHTRELDGSGLDRVLRLAVARNGLSVFVDQVVPPLMRRIGDEWREGRLTVAHEHLATAAVLVIIFESMRAVPEQPGAPRLLVATPSGERHGVGAALAALSATLDGWDVIYLGVDVPAQDIASAAASSGARAVALSVVHSERLGPVSLELRETRDALAADVPLIVGGAGAMTIAQELKRAGLIVCDTLADMRALFARDGFITGAPTP